LSALNQFAILLERQIWNQLKVNLVGSISLVELREVDYGQSLPFFQRFIQSIENQWVHAELIILPYVLFRMIDLDFFVVDHAF
jgi:hypothetical protein